MPLLAREDLDKISARGCEAEGCKEDHGPFFFHGKCHISSFVEACYLPESGIIQIKCATCKSVIADVLVASKDDR